MKLGFLILYAIAVGEMVLFVTVSYVVARLVGVRVDKITVGFPALIPLRRAKPSIRLGVIPGGSLDLYGAVEDTDEPDAWRQRPLGVRLVVILAPWVVTFGLALACLGTHAAASVVHGFRQILFTVNVKPLLEQMLAIAAHAPISTTIGIVLAKLVAMNLLPFGGVAGGLAVQELVSPRGREVSRRLQGLMLITLALFMLWTLGRFGWAIIAILIG